ncbi:MAG: NAD(P)-dependent alcohol dehydrogenase [Spirochaetales bacterium]|nr:MAG: NAD(P)-dependent alcohol dehydrogenase [Spirochaetales bacterium]
MKAIICTKYGPPEVLKIKQCKKPIPRRDEVLIKIYATSVTNSDIFIRSSNIPLLFMIPMRLMIGINRPRNPIIGEIFSGEIEFTGSETERFKVGDRVYGLTGFSLGAYADYKCMKEIDSKQGCLAIMPRNISFEEATSAAYGGLLAFQYLERGDISPGHKVLIYGASGTSGTIAVQYAKHLGATVTAVCGSSNIEFIKSLGADKVLDYTINESITYLEKYDLVMDTVGKRKTSELKKACVDALTINGKYVSIDDGALLLQSDRLNKITELIESGIIKPVNDRIYHFDQIIEAHKYVEMGHKKGNVAITVNKKNPTTVTA